jgi:hypothetical protein
MEQTFAYTETWWQSMRKTSARIKSSKNTKRPKHRTKLSKSKSSPQTPRKKPGPRPGHGGRPKAYSERVVVIIPQEQAAELDAWIGQQPDKPIRPVAIRRLIAIALHPTEPHPHATQQKPRTARARWDDYRPTPHQLQAIDTYRNMVRPALTRAEAVSFLVDTGLRSIAAPERIHAEGELGDWATAANIPPYAPKRPAHTPDDSGRAEDTPKTENAPTEPPRPPKND